MSAKDDKALGMNRPITRRDFVNGAAVAGVGLLAAGCATVANAAGAAAEPTPDIYPTELTGMRGSGYLGAYGRSCPARR